jgi:sterol desaturase/sphingolipid hydroxylase (fatty acid hydroxylase superfamily)
MFDQLNQVLSTQIASLQFLLLLINLVLHIIFAGAVAKDAGQMQKLGEKTALVNGVTWAFATLVGGVLIAVFYWFIHHSKLTRA